MMKNQSRLGLRVIAWGTLMACLCLEVQGAGNDARVGVASVDITPPPGIPMAGYYHARGADGVLDPLFSKAMVVETEGERAALVTLDTSLRAPGAPPVPANDLSKLPSNCSRSCTNSP